ncbi:MAG: hypothetical protein HYX89_06595 [Chloroflexi bacterium]|nr:hypothetical protein [Chloroflexota bacterium]
MRGATLGVGRILIVGSDCVLCRLLQANLMGPGREVVYIDPELRSPAGWKMANLVVLDVGSYSPGKESLYRAEIEQCQRSGGSVVLLYDPPWPSPSLAEFGAVKQFPKPVSLGEVAKSVLWILAQEMLEEDLP